MVDPTRYGRYGRRWRSRAAQRIDQSALRTSEPSGQIVACKGVESAAQSAGIARWQNVVEAGGVLRRHRVALGEHEAVAIGPGWILRIVPHEACPKRRRRARSSYAKGCATRDHLDTGRDQRDIRNVAQRVRAAQRRHVDSSLVARNGRRGARSAAIGKPSAAARPDDLARV